jgi:tetratricopeptide (TPR) repeat protein
MSAQAVAVTDFELELGGVERDIAELTERKRAAEIDTDGLRNLAYRSFQRASLTGEFADLDIAEVAIEEALAACPAWPDLWLVRAHLDFKVHRLGGVRRALARLDGLAVDSQARALQADLDLQEGRLEEALAGYRAAIDEEPTWSNLARLAHLLARMGDPDAADDLYAQAEDEITAKEMRSYAWVELERGALELRRGRYDHAAEHYRRAQRAYSGFWTVDEHVAEWLGATGRFDEAEAIYLDVVARVSRPELKQALGDLYAAWGHHDRAERWHRCALDAYLESAGRGEVHYLHHLADMCADLANGEGSSPAVRWAARDLELRENPWTQSALAWALYRDGALAQAVDLIDRALASGAQDTGLLRKAAAIYGAAGRTGEAEHLGRLATERDPRHGDFRAHR